jgi:hypothetical protein
LIDYCEGEFPWMKDWLQTLTLGHAAAFEFCWCWLCFEHCFDDLVDNDRDVSETVAGFELAKLIKVMTFNPFYLEYREHFFALLMSRIERWMDAAAIYPDEAKTRPTRAEIDLFLHVAYLLGGWDHRAAMLDAIRSNR